MAIGTVTPTRIKVGPGLIRYAPIGTTVPTFTASASKVTGTWTNWIDVGATDEGLSYAESTDTEDVRVAESAYAVRTIVTGKTATVSLALAQVDDLNWKLVSNGGVITTSGTGATKLNVYVPPLVGAEERKMLAYQSIDEEEVIIWYSVFNTGGFETARANFADKHTLPAEFSVELPDPAVATVPYRRWTSGNLAQFV